MGNIKRREIKAYILLESLITTGLLVFLVSLVLGGISTSRRYYQEALEREEVHQLAKMALQLGQSHLTGNGQEIQVSKTETGLQIYAKGEEILAISQK
ncbi:type II secretory pathway pseudopilin PulG [Streptococcus rupicaprae]|uniref:Type II secretory pathway pseudopilin PulG n=1 Tax=Streptococcus rupicaprae TaxID=759619 RepID=A0ABV2FH53_9STRE